MLFNIFCSHSQQQYHDDGLEKRWMKTGKDLTPLPPVCLSVGFTARKRISSQFCLLILLSSFSNIGSLSPDARRAENGQFLLSNWLPLREYFVVLLRQGHCLQSRNQLQFSPFCSSFMSPAIDYLWLLRLVCFCMTTSFSYQMADTITSTGQKRYDWVSRAVSRMNCRKTPRVCSFGLHLWTRRVRFFNPGICYHRCTFDSCISTGMYHHITKPKLTTLHIP